MSQVLRRACRLIQALAGQRGQPASTTRLAALTGIAAATASRLLHELERAGYADRHGHGRWSLGPEPQKLALASPYRRYDLPRVHRHLRRLQRCCGGSVLLACMRGSHRVILAQADPEPGAADLNERDDLGSTPSGRVLFAHLPPSERRRIVHAVGLPLPGWPATVNHAALADAVREVRRSEVVSITTRSWTALATLVCGRPGDPVALGLYLPHGVSEAHCRELGRQLVVAGRGMSDFGRMPRTGR